MLIMEARPPTPITKRLNRLQFPPDTPPKIIDLIRTDHQTLLRQQEWSFNFEEYGKKKASIIFEKASKVRITAIRLHYCKRSQFLEEIATVSFLELKCLYLSGNRIKNIEKLANIQMPRLITLILSSNFITSLRVLRKCSFKLKYIDVSNNLLKSLDDIWVALDLSELEEVNAFFNDSLLFSFWFAKSKVDFRKLKRIRLKSQMSIDLQEQLLYSLGVQSIQISQHPHYRI